jgi:hypothetical protein
MLASTGKVSGHMNAVSTRSALALRLAIASVASVWVLEAPGCSGTVINSNASRNNDGGADESSSSNGGSGNSPGGRGGGSAGIVVGGGTSPGGALCGNGRIDPGEACDGANLQGNDCHTVTMGAVPYGSLYCTACIFNLSGCFASGGGVGGQAGGPTYPGGMLGVGGSAGTPGTAGAAGMMGVDPVAVCYANGGVPDPANPSTCLSGAEATRICESHYVTSRLNGQEPLGLGDCASGCGCTSCPAQFDTCATNYECMVIMDCVERMNCSRMVDCYQPATCQSVIDSVGGQRGRAAIAMSNVLACMSSLGCTPSCSNRNVTPPPGR